MTCCREFHKWAGCLCMLTVMCLSFVSSVVAADVDSAAPPKTSDDSAVQPESTPAPPATPAATPATSDNAPEPAGNTAAAAGKEPAATPPKTPLKYVTPPAPKSGVPAAKPPESSGKALVLTGRIEELCKGNSAVLPLKWKKMEPIRDTSLDAKPIAGKAATTTLASGAQQQVPRAYPMDFRGTWSGTLTIFTRAFSPLKYQLDAAEATKEYNYMTPGKQGQTTITFFPRGASSYMEPCQVMFQSMQSMGELNANMAKAYGINSQQNPMFANMQNMQVPVMYSLHLGDLTNGTGVTGNQLQSRLMKNDIKQLRSDIIEQQVVTQDSDRNPQTGKTRLGYGESVLRFTRIDANRLYLQAATVNYANDGKFLNKVVLYGTLNRVANAGAGAAAPNNPMNPFGGVLPGSGGNSGNMMDAMRKLQDMMKQMQR